MGIYPYILTNVILGQQFINILFVVIAWCSDLRVSWICLTCRIERVSYCNMRRCMCALGAIYDMQPWYGLFYWKQYAHEGWCAGWARVGCAAACTHATHPRTQKYLGSKTSEVWRRIKIPIGRVQKHTDPILILYDGSFTALDHPCDAMYLFRSRKITIMKTTMKTPPNPEIERAIEQAQAQA